MKKLVLIPLALLFSASVFAAEGTGGFDQLDTDQDGSLSQEEASSAEGLDFEAADTNGDGSLSEEEFKAAQEGGDMEGMDDMEDAES